MELHRAARRAPLVVAIVLGAAVAVAALTLAWAVPADAEDSSFPKRDHSGTIDGSDSEQEAKAAGGVSAEAITPSSDALAIAESMVPPIQPVGDFEVTGASFVTKPPSGQPHAVSDTPLAGFPTNFSDYAILTTGSAALADDANTSKSSGADLNGSAVRGDTDRDVSIMKIDLNVPSDANCLAFDFRFLSEEFPEFVGSSYNDAFVAELDNSTWSTSGSTISAPNNFAFDQLGKIISINSTGPTSVSEADASGTTYDAATKLLQARTPVTPGNHSLYLSIFDQGDRIYDAAVFLDNLSVYSAPTGACQKGAKAGPTTVDISPEANATGVPLTTNVTSTFSKEMDATSLNSSTFQLYQGQWARVKKKKKGKKRWVWIYRWVPVSANVTYDAASKTATLDPASDLATNSNYLAVVTTGAKDSAGNPMDQAAIWTFTTGSS